MIPSFVFFHSCWQIYRTPNEGLPYKFFVLFFGVSPLNPFAIYYCTTNILYIQTDKYALSGTVKNLLMSSRVSRKNFIPSRDFHHNEIAQICWKYDLKIWLNFNNFTLQVIQHFTINEIMQRYKQNNTLEMNSSFIVLRKQSVGRLKWVENLCILLMIPVYGKILMTLENARQRRCGDGH